MTGNYYRPTPGEDVGTWNVFHRDGSVLLGVPFQDLPREVQEYLWSNDARNERRKQRAARVCDDQ